MLTPVSLSDLDPVSQPTLILVPIDFENEPPILDSHIPLLGNEFELEFYDLDQTHGPASTLESKFDLSFIPESISVPIPFIVELISSILQNHIPLLDQGLNQYDSVMISQYWSYNQKNFHVRIMHDPIHIGSIKMSIGKRS